MDSSSLVIEQIDAGHRFLTEFGQRFPIKAAFWLKEPEQSKWNLYVASELIGADGLTQAHEELARVVVSMNDPHLSLFRVKRLPVDDPRVAAALDVHRRYPEAGPVHHFEMSFGGVSVSGVYIYPPLKQGEKAFQVDMERGESFTVSGHFQDALTAAIQRWRTQNGGRSESAIEIPFADLKQLTAHWNVYVVDAINQPRIPLCRITLQHA